MRLICLLIVISTNYMVPNFTAKNLVNAGGMFQNGRCTEINFQEMESRLENADDMFNQSYTTKDRCKAIRFPKISIIGIGSKAETKNPYNLFSGRHNLEKVKLKNNFLEPRTEYSRFNLFYTFSGCKNLTIRQFVIGMYLELEHLHICLMMQKFLIKTYQHGMYQMQLILVICLPMLNLL